MRGQPSVMPGRMALPGSGEGGIRKSLPEPLRGGLDVGGVDEIRLVMTGASRALFRSDSAAMRREAWGALGGAGTRREARRAIVPVRKVTGGARADWSDAQSEVGNRWIFAGRLEWSEHEG